MEYKGLKVESQREMLLNPAGRLSWKRVTVALPPELWARVKRQALAADVSANELTRAILAQWLEAAERE